jgi:hypothetical protein
MLTPQKQAPDYLVHFKFEAKLSLKEIPRKSITIRAPLHKRPLKYRPRITRKKRKQCSRVLIRAIRVIRGFWTFLEVSQT